MAIESCQLSVVSCRDSVSSESLWRQLGFSLVEMMVALTLGSILMGALLTGLYQTQKWTENLSRMAHRDSNLQQAHLLLSRLISSAGNNLASDQGVEIQPGQLILRSDLSGAAGGFPDGSLDDSFESLALRCKEGKLLLQSGNGTFQTLIEPVEEFQPMLQTPRLLQLKLTAATGNLAGLGRSLSETMELWHSLPERRPNLFAKED